MAPGKVGGRLLLLGPIGRRSLTLLATVATVIQLAGLALPLGITASWILFPTMVVVGAASGATTVLRPLLVVDLVGASRSPPPSPASSAPRHSSAPPAPLVLGVAVTAFSWSIAWAGCLTAFASRCRALPGARPIRRN